MSLWSWIKSPFSGAGAMSRVSAQVGTADYFQGLNDPRLIEFMRAGGSPTASGISVSVDDALKNTTVMRCVSLIAFSIAMLPLHVRYRDTKEKASDHAVYKLLHRRPNAWQTAFEFRALMQERALTHGDAFALKVESAGRIVQLVPLEPSKITVRQRTDWSLEYVYTRPDGGTVVYPQSRIFHLRYGISKDGMTGVSLVAQAAEAIGLALQAEAAAASLFKNGLQPGQAVKHPNKISQEAYDRLKASLDEREGARNFNKTIILEEGMALDSPAQSGRDSQAIEQRRHQIEEVARPFGVPRPLLGVDDTSWGSGIDVLGQFFVRYGLNPWFEVWQQAGERSLFSERDAETYEVKFNPAGLLRGSFADQAEFFAKGLGAGGHHPFLSVSEIRGWLDLPENQDLPPAMGQSNEGRP